jgi:hypothetical protein
LELNVRRDEAIVVIQIIFFIRIVILNIAALGPSCSVVWRMLDRWLSAMGVIFGSVIDQRRQYEKNCEV